MKKFVVYHFNERLGRIVVDGRFSKKSSSQSFLKRLESLYPQFEYSLIELDNFDF